ncbi:MAG TPA: hypothetical protein VFD49_00675 [Candidatus Dormibacteraeota bacterium]|nr:hypothetical protein [Candidatus Dormibacteraeota bacterium]
MLPVSNHQRAPKRLRIEDVRRVLGDAETSRLVEVIQGRPARRRRTISVEQLQRARHVLFGKSEDDEAWTEALPVLREYLNGHSQTRKAMIRWIDRELEEALLGV